MATAASLTPKSLPAATAHFDQVLSEFKAELSQHEVDDFSYTTAADLKEAIHQLQEEQASKKRMQNLRRLNAFVEAMDQYDKVIQVFLNATQYLGFIWGPAKFMLLVASSHGDALNTLLEAYQEIGEHMPLLEQYESLMVNNPYLQQVVGFIYKDILDFHRKAMKHFRQRAWKQLFHATWKTFRTNFSAVLSSLQSHRKLLDSQTILVGVEETVRAINELQQTRRIFEAECQRSQDEEAKKRQRAVIAWLSAADSATDHEDALAVQGNDPESGRWLFQQNSIKSWVDLHSLAEPLLWIKGKPGAGKTILASVLIEECRRRLDSAVAFFYCKHGDPTRNSFMAFTRSVVLQLSQLKPSLLPFILDKASSSGTDSLKSPKVAKDILNVALESFDNLSLVIDGIDECVKSQKDEISSWVRSTVTAAQANHSENLRCCFLSQDDNDTGRLFKALPTFRIAEQHNSSDILRYCRLRASEIGVAFGLPSQDVQDLAECVSRKADGMFLYAKLVMENLSCQVSRAALRKEVERIPPNLDQVYGRIKYRILDESSPPDRQVAKTLLSWLLCAKRPLKWHEVQGAMSLDLDDDSFDADRRLVRDIKHFCGSLVEVRQGGAIGFVHLTARFFLQHEPALPRQLEQLNLTRLCFSHLTLDSHDLDMTQDSIRQYVLDGHYAFTEYAVVHAFDHLHDVCSQTEAVCTSDYSNLRANLRKFVARRVTAPAKRAPPTKFINDSLAMFKKEDFFNNLGHAAVYAERSPKKTRRDVDDESTLTLDTQLAGVRVVMEKMITVSGLGPTLEPIYGKNPFKCSNSQCESFHEGFATQQARDRHRSKHDRVFFCSFPGCHSSIFGFGTAADLNKHEQDYHQGVCDGNSFPWHGTLESLNIDEEIKRGNFPAFELWLSQWEELIPQAELQKWFYRSNDTKPLVTTCRFGQRRMFESMLGKINLEEIKSEHIKACSHEALKIHDEETAATILKRFTRFSDPEIFSMLKTALNLGLDSAAAELLKYPSSALFDPSKRSRHASYLNLAIRYGRQAIFRQLLGIYGVKPQQEDDKGRTSLIAVAEFDQVEIASYLIETVKCDKWAPNSRGDTALKMAGRQGHEEFISSIFRDDLQTPEVQAWFRTSQLRNAVCIGDDRRVGELLDGGLLHADETDSRNFSPWMWAVKKGHKRIVEIFLNRTDILFVRNAPPLVYNKGPGVLHFAASAGYDSVMQMLLQSGKFSSEVDRSCFTSAKRLDGELYETPLKIAKRCDHHETVEVIEEYKASLADNLRVCNTLAELEIDQLPDNFKKERQDWFAVFNPRVRRLLDVDLIHNLSHQSVVCCVRFSLDGRFVATGCNRSTQIFDVETGTLVAHFQDGSLPEDGDLYIRSVCFSPNGAYLATGAEDKVIRVWDIQNRSIKTKFTGHDQDIYSLDFARNGRLIASGSVDSTVRLWDLETNSLTLCLSMEDVVTTVAISPDNRFVAAGSVDKSVCVWDIHTGQHVARLEGEVGHKDSVYSVDFAPSGDRLFSGSLDKTIKMWELTTPSHMISGSVPSGKCIRTFEGHKDFVLSVALTQHGEWVLSGSKDRGVQFWDPITGVAQLMLQGHKNSVISVAPSPTGGVFATGSGDMRARIWRYGRYTGPQ